MVRTASAGSEKAAPNSKLNVVPTPASPPKKGSSTRSRTPKISFCHDAGLRGLRSQNPKQPPQWTVAVSAAARGHHPRHRHLTRKRLHHSSTAPTPDMLVEAANVGFYEHLHSGPNPLHRRHLHRNTSRKCRIRSRLYDPHRVRTGATPGGHRLNTVGAGRA